MEKLENGHYYHLYNRGAGRSNLFQEGKDYHRFIDKYRYYMFFTVETYAWCLIQNHFHVLIKVRSLHQQEVLFQKSKGTYPKGSFFGDNFKHAKPYDSGVQYRHLMNSYTKYFNKKYRRSGTLVEGTFKRKRITDENHFNHLLCYIHRNPIHHGICRKYEDYPYTSYHDYIGNKRSFTETEKGLENFGGVINLQKAHSEFRLMLNEEYYLES